MLLLLPFCTLTGKKTDSLLDIQVFFIFMVYNSRVHVQIQLKKNFSNHLTGNYDESER